MVLRILESIGAPSIVRNSRVDYLALTRVVGELELNYEVLDLSADDGLTVSVYSADPGSRSQEALDLLASWTGTPEGSPTTVND